MPTLFDHTNNRFNQNVTFANPALSGPITITQDGLISDSSNNALRLSGGIYTVTVNGGLVSQYGTGLMLNFVPAVSAISKVTVGATGVISGAQAGVVSGLFVSHGLTLVNDGLIEGEYAVDIEGPGAVKITNNGVINGSNCSVYSVDASIHNITNTGEMYGTVQLFTGADTLVNSGLINGLIFMGGGADVLTNSGTIDQDISLNTGNDKLTNTGQIWARVFAAEGNDTITNSDIIAGLVDTGTGNDVLTNKGSIGSDVYMDLGSDLLTNSGRIDGFVTMSDGNDTITNSGRIEEYVVLGSGNDKFTNSGTVQSDVFGESGNDVLTNSGTIEGDVSMGEGNDTFTNTGEVDDWIYMGSGNDKFVGGKFADTVVDEAGSDNYALGDGDDLVFGNGFGAATGIDTIDGGANARVNFALGRFGDFYQLGTSTAATVNLDTLSHTFLGKTVAAGRVINSDSGTDLVKNIESVQTGTGNDTVFGSVGANHITTNSGNDVVHGYGGNDWITGGEGEDSLAGGLGRDTLIGGADTDRFVFTSTADSTMAASGRDKIMDFDSNDDYLDFRPMAIAGGHQIGVDVAFDGSKGARILTTSTGYLVQVDINGDRKGDLSVELYNPTHTIDWVFQSNFQW